MAKISSANLVITVSKIVKDNQPDSFKLDEETVLLLNETLEAIFSDKNDIVVELTES